MGRQVHFNLPVWVLRHRLAVCSSWFALYQTVFHLSIPFLIYFQNWRIVKTFYLHHDRHYIVTCFDCQALFSKFLSGEKFLKIIYIRPENVKGILFFAFCVFMVRIIRQDGGIVKLFLIILAFDFSFTKWLTLKSVAKSIT